MGSRHEAHRALKRVSPSRGGPASARGNEYQNQTAALEILLLVRSELWDPSRSSSVSIESRLVGPSGQADFDLTVSPPRRQIEVKLKPRRDEIAAWLRLVRDSYSQDLEATFALVHARGSSSAADITEVHRTAIEARDEGHFDSLCRATHDGDQCSLVAELGDRRWDLARRIYVIRRSESETLDRLRSYSEALSGPTAGRNVLEFLTTKILAAQKDRQTLRVSEIIAELRRRRIPLHAPLSVEIPDLDPAVASSLAILQECSSPLPISVLADALSINHNALLATLTPHIRRGLLQITDASVQLPTLLPTPLSVPNESQLLATTLRALLSIATQRNRRAEVVSQLGNILRLAMRCLPTNPPLVAAVFPALDKLVKDTGDFHLVLELACLSDRAARKSPDSSVLPTPETLRHRAQTLICGLSWVYQRVGSLRRAQEYAEASLALGQDLRWDRNSAFCKKCLGRLCRIRAEASTVECDRADLLTESLRYLDEARLLFERLTAEPDLGPRSEDVGECWSLMARTHFVRADQEAASRSIARARDILESYAGSKAWADLLLLEGELYLAEDSFDPAVIRADEVLQGLTAVGHDASEIKARALVLRATSRKKARQYQLAAEDYGRAAEIYHKLDYSGRHYENRWEELQALQSAVPGTIPPELAEALAGEQDLGVRVETLLLHSEETRPLSVPARGRRSILPPLRIESLLSRARLRARQQQTGWE